MSNDEIIALVARIMRMSASPSVNGLHEPDRYQASVHAEDMGAALQHLGLIENRHAFYDMAMPERGCTDTWNSLHDVIYGRIER